jgi:hypothetical protein
MPRLDSSKSLTNSRVTIWVAGTLCLIGRAGIVLPWALSPPASPWDHVRTPSTAEDCRSATPPPVGDGSFFTNINDQVGLDFHHVVGPLGTYFMPESVGAGGAFFDYDQDGDLDLYLVNSGRSPMAPGDLPRDGVPRDEPVENRLFRQESDGRFTDVTGESGLGDRGYGMGCAIGDIDNDGDLDVYVTNYGLDRLYQNNGDGTFSDITQLAGIRNSDWGTSAVFFDYDRDGRLDLFVTNYTADPQFGHSIACGFYQGRVSYCGPLKFQPTVDRLFHNEGAIADSTGEKSIRFRDVTTAAGLAVRTTNGLAAVSADLDRDGWPDLYVANDAGMNPLWINRRDGTFADEGGIRGAAFDGRGQPEGSMGIGLGDFDGDCDIDLVVTNLATEGASVFRNEGQGLFIEHSDATGLRHVTRPHTGWGTALVDLDHDGNLDLPLVNGLVVPCHAGFAPHGEETFVERNDLVTDAGAFWREYADFNLLFFSGGAGTFGDRTSLGGDFSSAIGSGRALMYGDVDNDGDLDLLVTNCGGPARLYRNDVPKQGQWLQVRLLDSVGQRDAYGAEVTVTAGNRNFLRIANPAGSYLTSDDLRLHFGLGPVDQYSSIIVRWPDATLESFPGGPTQRLVVLKRGDGTPVQSIDPTQHDMPPSGATISTVD